MRTAGMFAELGRVKQDEPQPSITDHVLASPLPDADRVVAYLRAGHRLLDFMDISDDVFDPSRQVLGGPSVLTDGDWMWRDDLAYYVEWHQVTPPPELLELIRRRHYIMPIVADDVLDALVEPAVRLMS
ncbi:hypothetical protein [Actinoplanes sp. NPDC049265]|uniref:hypothetical protein n=1 Tax=Actinoplanes sp. NPDC049265 TaxID=3363902 RepID=UPI00372170E1